MKTLVVYDSVYGNTEIIARTIGNAIPGEVEVLHVGQVNAGDLETVDLLIIGSPTHGALPTEAVQGLVEKIGPPTCEGAKAATFDTRLTWWFLERWGGFAAPKMADTLKEKGWTLAGAPEGFFVKGLRKGPLKRGEADRAAAWAKGLVGSRHSSTAIS
jgi:flavodoxin I